MTACAERASRTARIATVGLTAAGAPAAVAASRRMSATTAPVGASADPIATVDPAVQMVAMVSASPVARGANPFALTMGSASSALRPVTVPIRGNVGSETASTTPASRALPTTAPIRAMPALGHRSAVAAHAPTAASRGTVRHQQTAPRPARRAGARRSATTPSTVSAGRTRGCARNAVATTTSAPFSTEAASMGSASVRARTSRDAAWSASTSASSRTTVAPATARAQVDDVSTVNAPTLIFADSSATPNTIQTAM